MRRYEKTKAGSTKKIDEELERQDLDQLARQGALRMLKDVLEQEVSEFLGRSRYERSEEFNGYRNGYGKRRKVAVGSGTLELRAPRLRTTLEPFESQVLGRYQRQSGSV